MFDNWDRLVKEHKQRSGVHTDEIKSVSNKEFVPKEQISTEQAQKNCRIHIRLLP